MDSILGFSHTIRKHNLILVFVDRFSITTYFIPCIKTADPSNVAYFFCSELVRIYGLSKSIVSKYNIRFTSHFVKLCDIAIKISSSYHSQADDYDDWTEMVNHSLGDLFSCLMGEQLTTWYTILLVMEFAYNNSVNRSTGLSPFEIVTGYKSKSIDLSLPMENRPNTLVESFTQYLHYLHDYILPHNLGINLVFNMEI